MTQHDVDAVAFPRLDKAQLAILDRCPLTKRGRHEDGESSSNWATATSSSSSSSRAGSRSWTSPATRRGRSRSSGPASSPGTMAQVTGGPTVVGGVARGDARSTRSRMTPCGRSSTSTRTWATSSCGRSSPADSCCASRATFMGLARDRLPLLAGDLPAPRLPGQEPDAVHLAGPGGRPAGETTARRFGLTEADTPVVAWGRKLLPAQPLEPRAGRGPRPPPAAGADGPTTWWWSGPARRGWPPRSTAPRRA